MPALDLEGDRVAEEVGTGTGGSGRRDWWGAAWFVLGTLTGVHLLSDNSYLTHLATGRLLLDGYVPHADPYTYTAAGRPWVVQSWLFSLIEAGLERTLGAWSLRWLMGLVIGALLATLWRLSRPAGTVLGRVAVTAGAAAVGLGYWNERPQTVAFLLLACTLVVLVERWRAAWLIPIFALWVDLHGSWPVGVGVVGLVVLQRVVDARRLERSSLTPPLAAVLGCLIGAAASPYGADLLTFPMQLLGRSDVLRYIVEWRPPSISDPTTLALAAQAGLALWAIRRQRAWGWLPLVVVMLGLAATGRRNVPLASLALVVVAAPALAGLGTMRLARPAPRRAVAVLCLGAAVVMASVTAAMPRDYDLGPYPVAAVDWMESRNLVATAGVRVAHPDYVGNYLEWRFGRDARVFVDDRAEILDAELVEDYAQVLIGGEGDWRVVLDRYDVEVVLWPVASELGRELAVAGGPGAGDWTVAHRIVDGSGVPWLVACRAGSAAATRC